MIVTHRLEWYGEEGFQLRNKEWQRRDKVRKETEAKLPKGKELPIEFITHPYTEARRIGDFWHMTYGLFWEEKIR